MLDITGEDNNQTHGELCVYNHHIVPQLVVFICLHSLAKQLFAVSWWEALTIDGMPDSTQLIAKFTDSLHER